MSYSYSSTVPIQMLPGIGRRTAKVLHRLEVHTIGQFKSMPERVLVELFGPSISHMHQTVQSSAFAARPTKPSTPKPHSVQKTLSVLPFSQRLRLATQLLML